jgi:hypothetical protein
MKSQSLSAVAGLISFVQNEFYTIDRITNQFFHKYFLPRTFTR